ncbi:uncharacterized protein EDB91DRAFT_256714 [Suillus paluster]|uniref:uncharacterized protein n=1 Tax=Suillus paluster TaxID=48578 RepID=UPI001B869DF8|nr:uncharacterized protein EDB91DRAFT_256714 [Suillus paluster]KAG1754857.1 hypothetical protein EDB91DRAFT_256714 [Suillus paluster]
MAACMSAFQDTIAMSLLIPPLHESTQYAMPHRFKVGAKKTKPLVLPAQLMGHLKLLNAFFAMRQRVEEGDVHFPDLARQMSPEKRWAWFVTLAVERFERWCGAYNTYERQIISPSTSRCYHGLARLSSEPWLVCRRYTSHPTIDETFCPLMYIWQWISQPWTYWYQMILFYSAPATGRRAHRHRMILSTLPRPSPTERSCALGVRCLSLPPFSMKVGVATHK